MRVTIETQGGRVVECAVRGFYGESVRLWFKEAVGGSVVEFRLSDGHQVGRGWQWRLTQASMDELRRAQSLVPRKVAEWPNGNWGESTRATSPSRRKADPRQLDLFGGKS